MFKSLVITWIIIISSMTSMNQEFPFLTRMTWSTSKGVDLDGERQFSWQLKKTPVTCQVRTGWNLHSMSKLGNWFSQVTFHLWNPQAGGGCTGGLGCSWLGLFFATPQMGIVKWKDISLLCSNLCPLHLACYIWVIYIYLSIYLYIYIYTYVRTYSTVNCVGC